jgi:membrane protein
MGSLRTMKVAFHLFKEVGEDDLPGAACELSYKLFLAMFPFLIFLTALGGFVAEALDVDNPAGEVIGLVGGSLPLEANELLREQVSEVTQSRDGTLLSIGILGSVWAASSAVGTLMKTLNRVYEVKETRSMLKRYGLAVGLTLLAGGAIVAAFVLMLAGQLAGSEVAEAVGLEDQVGMLLIWLRWPAAIVLLLSAVAFLYWAAPNVDLPFKWISPGALLFVAISLPATFLFGIYVANFGSYSETYGTLGGVVILLVWLYIVGFFLLLGAQLNSVLAQETAPKELERRAGAGVTAATATGGGPTPSDPLKGASGQQKQSKWAEYVTGAVLAAVAVWGAVRSRLTRRHAGAYRV